MLHRTQVAILEQLAWQTPPPTQRELAAALNVSQTTIVYHLRRLRGAGLITHGTGISRDYVMTRRGRETYAHLNGRETT